MNPIPRLADAFFFCSLGEASAAAALAVAVSQALAFPLSWRVLGLVFAGTLAVYNLDRLRDLDRDRVHSPLRSAFIARRQRWLNALVVMAAAAAVACGIPAGPGVVFPALALLALGVTHRRLKRFRTAKPVYLAGAWTMMVVGLPVVASPWPLSLARVAWAAGLVSTALLANAMAAGIRPGAPLHVGASPGGSLPVGGAPAWWSSPVAVLRALPREAKLLLGSRACAALAALASLFAPAGVRSLGVIPLVLLCALLVFRADERFRLVFLDGSLLAGALAAASIAVNATLPGFEGFIVS